MTLRITRREALGWIAGLGAAAGAVLAGVRWSRTPAESSAAPEPAAPEGATTSPPDAGAAPESPFPFLDIDPAALRAFARDYQTHQQRTLAAGEWTDAIRAQFLLSTDFFRFDADESRRILYVGYYDPAVTPCNNPLAQLD